MDPTVSGQTLINFRRVVQKSNLPFFRSGEMTQLSFEDASFLADRYKIHSYFDLRTTRELELFGKSAHLSKVGIHWHHQPMDQITDPFFTIKVPTPRDYGLFYLRMLPSAIESLHRIVYFFNQSPCIIGFGCGGGKDRTGVVAALLLKMLDYDDATIIDDYLLSAEYILRKIDYFVSRYKPVDIPDDLYKEQILSKPESISILLSYLGKNTDWRSQMNLQAFYQLKKKIEALCTTKTN